MRLGGLNAIPFERRLLQPIVLVNQSSVVRLLSMDMIRVSSSAIAAVGYDPTTRKMKIRFVAGHTYDFCRVPESVFTGLLKAQSKGVYYNDHIRDRYPC